MLLSNWRKASSEFEILRSKAGTLQALTDLGALRESVDVRFWHEADINFGTGDVRSLA
jgi:hypothetical protein